MLIACVEDELLVDVSGISIALEPEMAFFVEQKKEATCLFARNTRTKNTLTTLVLDLETSPSNPSSGVPPPRGQAPRVQRPRLHAQLRRRALQARRDCRGRARGQRSKQQRRRRRHRRRQRSLFFFFAFAFLASSSSDGDESNRQGPRRPRRPDARRGNHDGLGRGRGPRVVRLLEPQPGRELRVRREFHFGCGCRVKEEQREGGGGEEVASRFCFLNILSFFLSLFPFGELRVTLEKEVRQFSRRVLARKHGKGGFKVDEKTRTNSFAPVTFNSRSFERHYSRLSRLSLPLLLSLSLSLASAGAILSCASAP